MGESIQFTTPGFVWNVSGCLVTKVCPVCGVPYAVPEELDVWNRKAPSRYFYCPNGHELHYAGKSEARQLEEARDALAVERSLHDQTRARLSAQKGKATRARRERDRLRDRAAAGVCPCCHRTFKQLALHMKSKHPGFPGSYPDV